MSVDESTANSLLLGSLLQRSSLSSLNKKVVCYRHSFKDDTSEIQRVLRMVGSRDQDLLNDYTPVNAEEKYSNLRFDSSLVELSCTEMGNDEFADVDVVLCFASFEGHGSLGEYLGALTVGRKLTYDEFVDQYASRICRAPESVKRLYEAPDMYLIDGLGLSKRPQRINCYRKMETNREMLPGLEGRLIVKWPSRNPKCINIGALEVFSIRPPGFVKAFNGFLDLKLNYSELSAIVRNSEANIEWKNKLSSVSGIYLIRHERRSELYVGSAYGVDGIWGRWSSYAADWTGGNKALIELRRVDQAAGVKLSWSILEVLPKNTSFTDVLGYESKWKEKLGSRVVGLGLNRN